MEPEENLIKQRLKKLEEIKKLGIEPYPYRFKRTKTIAKIKEVYKEIKKDEFSDYEQVCGRIISIRKFGKITFVVIRDNDDDLQLVFKKDLLKNKYDLLRLLDIGDFLGAKGKVSRTKSNELSIFVEEYEILSKSLRPLPEKYHGIKDKELRYRQRYLDLIMNLNSRKVFYKKHLIIRYIREYLFDKGFIEIETPILQPVYGGANARPFITHHHALDINLYLKISPELYLKRLIIGGFEKVFEITKCFRNEGIDAFHNPEFTMLELYWAYSDYNDIMKLTEELIKHVVYKVNSSYILKYEDKEIDLSKPWKVITMYDALKKYANIDVKKLNLNELKEMVDSLNIELKGTINRGILINALFEELVEEKLIEPTFVIDYPVEVCPLTKRHRKDKELTERFELFMFGIEIANAYSELNDPIDQRKRFEEQEKERKEGNEEIPPKDMEFLKALEYGMPPTGGLGIGIDRLTMFITSQESIRDVIPFPAMKPKEK